jgi:hypothetical protein
MARIRSLACLQLEIEAKHDDVSATYAIVKEPDGGRCLQIDSYGSSHRKIRGKKSQTMRFTAAAVAQLRSIIDSHF